MPAGINAKGKDIMKKITQKALSLLLVMLITVTSIIALTPIKADAATVFYANGKEIGRVSLHATESLSLLSKRKFFHK